MNNQSMIFKITNILIKIAFTIAVIFSSIFLILIIIGFIAPNIIVSVVEGLGHQWNQKYFNIVFDKSIIIDNELLLFLCEMSLQFIKILFITFILFVLKKIFTNLNTQNYFDMANIKYIRLIGLVIIIGNVIYSIFSVFYTKLIINSVDFTSVQIRLSTSFQWEGILLGLIILCIAEIYQRGSTLQQEHNYTV